MVRHRPPAAASVLLMLLLSAHCCQGGILRGLRLLLEMGAPEVGKARWGDSLDPSITNQVSARWGAMKRPPARQSLTFQDAESTSGATFPGVHRLAAPHVVMATADAQSNLQEPRKKSTVKTRARSAVTRPWQQEQLTGGRAAADWPNLASGASSMPAVTMGNLVMAQTFEGATATSLSDSMALPSVSSPSRGTAVAYNLATSKATKEYRAATTRASWATTAQPVKSLALTGPANHRFAIAQAGEAVAMSQIQRSNNEALPANLRRQHEEGRD